MPAKGTTTCAMAPSDRDGATVEDVARTYLSLFAGRDDAYNRHTGSTYITVREALTPAVIVAAWTATPPTTVGAFFMAPDNSCHVLAYDFDRADGWNLACQLGTVMWAAGAPAYVERSREGRAHLWATADKPLPSIVLRRAQRVWMADAGILATGADLDAAHIELRPGKDRLNSPGSLGRALRLPGMPNPVTSERHPLADPRTGQPVATTVAAMLGAYKRVPTGYFLEAAERYRPTEPPPPPRLSMPGPGCISSFNARIGVSQILEAAGAAWARPGGHGRCPFHADRNPSMSVSHNDRRAWCFSRSCAVNRDDKGMDAWDLARLSHQRAT